MAHLMALEGTAAVKGKVGSTPPSLDVSAASTYTTKVPCIIICFARTRRIGRTLSSSTATLSQGPYPLPPTLLVVDRLTVDCLLINLLIWLLIDTLIQNTEQVVVVRGAMGTSEGYRTLSHTLLLTRI